MSRAHSEPNESQRALRDLWLRRAGVRGGAGGLPRELRAPERARRRLLRLLPRREGRRPLGRNPKQVDGRALGGGHDGHRLLHDQGHGRPGDGARPLAGPVRLRRAREHVLAGVRPARERRRSPSGSCSRTRRGCSRSTSGRSRASSRIPTGWPSVLARQKPAWEPRDAAGLPRHHARLLRERAPAPGRSEAPHPRGSTSRMSSPTPLGLDFYIRLPETIPDSRLAPLQRFQPAPSALLLAAASRCCSRC